MNQKHTFSEYLPLIIIIGLIIAYTAIRQILMPALNIDDMLYDCMSITFLLFGGIKMLKWQGFIEAFRSYDEIAQRYWWYAAAYPLIEVGLGILYGLRLFPIFTTVLTIITAGLTTISVVKELHKDRPFPCACLGAVFVLPMTWVTLVENLVMILMASWLLIRSM